VGPDHFDHPAAAKPGVVARSNKVAVHHHARSNATWQANRLGDTTRPFRLAPK
jgi:hypothetical protein